MLSVTHSSLLLVPILNKIYTGIRPGLVSGISYVAGPGTVYFQVVPEIESPIEYFMLLAGLLGSYEPGPGVSE